MKDYLVLARKYRPQLFREVLGQEAIVTTLKNAMRLKRIAHAYLFCGSRGTGKTTLARLFAKALNCQNLTADFEPCSCCDSCKEISSGNSLDILEIDGASNRGIEDIRQINETVGYAAASGRYKIYIIDEVHMLTKEAFNALLKTLEEPPPKVKFFFATTEPHKVLPTILSRCQRFNLNRIPNEKISEKLRIIAKDLDIVIEEDALRMITQTAEGGLRDAESVLDQVISFSEGTITLQSVMDALGIVSKDNLFALDKAGAQSNIIFAFELADLICSKGKDLLQFIEGLVEHFRTILLIKSVGVNSPLLFLSGEDTKRYQESAALYSQGNCLAILDFLVESQNQFKFAQSKRITLETILLRIIRMHHQVPVEWLVRRLSDLEKAMAGGKVEMGTPPAPAVIKQATALPQPISPKPAPSTTSPAPVAAISSPQPPKPARVAKIVDAKTQARHDTLLRFAAVELEGTIKK